MIDYTLFIRNLVQGLVLQVPYFWTSDDHIVAIKLTNSSLTLSAQAKPKNAEARQNIECVQS